MGDPAPEISLSASWSKALSLFDRDLVARSAAEATRKAYANDVGQLAVWADSMDLEPASMGHRDVRRFAAVLSERGISKAGVARKLAAIRAFYGALLRADEVSANPADLVATPKQDRKLPRVLSREEMQTLLDRIPIRTPLEMRDRAMLELAYSCGLRAEEVVNLNTDSPDFDGERLRIEGKGGKTRLVPMGEPAQAALTGYLERGRHALVGGDGGAGSSGLKERPAASPLGRAPALGALGARGGNRRRSLAPCPASLFRDPPAGGRRGPAEHPRAPWARQSLDDAGLHPSGTFLVAKPVRSKSSSCVRESAECR